MKTFSLTGKIQVRGLTRLELTDKTKPLNKIPKTVKIFNAIIPQGLPQGFAIWLCLVSG